MLALVYITVIALGLVQWGNEIHDPDLGWHLAGGQWISEHQSLPAFDFINSLNPSWHDYHWLSQLLLYGLYTIGGYPLLRLCYGALLAYIGVVLTDTVRILMGRRDSKLLVLALSVLGLALVTVISSIRPQMIALCILAVCNRRLIQRPKRHEIVPLLALTVLTANFHVYWVFIPGLWFCYRVLPQLIRGSKRRAELNAALLGLVCLSAAGLCTPYGVQSYALILDYLRMPPYLKRSIAEFQSPFVLLPGWGLLIVAHLVIVARALHTRRALARIGHITVAISSAVLALWSVKYVGVFAVLGLPFIARSSYCALRHWAPRLLSREQAYVAVAAVPISLLCLVYAAIEFPFLEKNKHEGILDERFAAPACQALAAVPLHPTHQRDHIRLLTHFNQGGWCRWQLLRANRALDIRVTSDGRTQYVPEQRFHDHSDLFEGRERWSQVLSELSPDAALVPTDSALHQLLELSGNWKSVFHSKEFSIFVPQ